jgi:hypothetical protein
MTSVSSCWLGPALQDTFCSRTCCNSRKSWLRTSLHCNLPTGLQQQLSRCLSSKALAALLEKLPWVNLNDNARDLNRP